MAIIAQVAAFTAEMVRWNEIFSCIIKGVIEEE